MTPADTASTDPDARVVWDLLDGFRASKAAFTAVSLGVFDHLHKRPTTIVRRVDPSKPAESCGL